MFTPAAQSITVETAPITASVARTATPSTSSHLGAPRVAAPAVGTVTTSALNLRTGPGTGYAVITTLSYGTQGTVLGQSNGWYNIQTTHGTGWVSGTYFSVGAAAPTAPAPAPASGTGYVTISALNMRTGPGTGYGVIAVLGYGTQGTIVGQANGWYNIQTTVGTGWVIGTYFSVGGAPAPAAPAPAPAPPAPAPASNVAAIAWQYVGYPYVYGAAGPGAFDCSGFTQYVYARAGMSITRTTYTQYNTPGTRIGSYAGLQSGDLMFFANTAGPGITHVGIYVGNGQMIHAGTPATGVEVTNINYSFWTSHFAGAIRPYR
jgi:cell wall-associated NlpC family hydrolase